MAEWYPKERLGDLPAEAARRWGAREALVCGGARWTYRDFDREVDRVAKGLMALGVEQGEHVALWMNNRPEWLFLVFAIAKIGAVLVPLNTRYRTEDVAYTVRQSDSGTWISIDRSGPVDYAAMLAEVLPKLAAQDPRAAAIEGFPRLRRLVVVGESDVPGTLGWEAMLAGGEPVSDVALAARADAVDPDEPVMIGYTSGTTGHPKGVLHTHVMIRNMRERANRIGLTFEDVIVNPLPLFHMYGFSEAGLIAVIAGCKHLLLDRFDADECMRLVEAEKGTITHGFDTHYKEYLDSLARTPRDISSLRFGTFPSGMTSSARIARQVQTEMVPTFTGWGMTETFTFATMSFGNSTPEQRSDASGFPAPGFEIKVVDPETGHEVAAGEEGELLIRGYMITQATTRSPRRPPRPSTATAGCTPAIRRCFAPTGTSASSAASRTSSRSAARTSHRRRSKPSSWPMRRSTRWRWWATRTRGSPRSPWPSSCPRRASPSRTTRSPPTARGASRALKSRATCSRWRHSP